MSGISTSFSYCNYISYNCQQGISDDVVLDLNLVLCVSLRGIGLSHAKRPKLGSNLTEQNDIASVSI